MGVSRQNGFSLIELLIVIAVIAIGTAVAMPTVLSMRDNFRLRGAASDLLTAFKMARGEAVKGGGVCAITFNQPDGGQTFDYLVFADANGNLVFDAGEARLLPPVLLADRAPGVTLVNHNLATNSAGLQVIAYNNRGLLAQNVPNNAGVTMQHQNGRTRIFQVTQMTGAVRLSQ